MTVQRRTVLVVEDSLAVRATLIRILGRVYDVATADDGETALCRIKEGRRFDVVLCDLIMPRMDGAVFVEELRRLDADQASRVIMLTGNARSPLAARLAGHYVVEKPFDVGELRALIDRVSGAMRNGYSPPVPVVAVPLVDSGPA